MMRMLETREKSGRSLPHVTEEDLETTGLCFVYTRC